MEGDIAIREIVAQITDQGVNDRYESLSLQWEEVVIRSILFVCCQTRRVERDVRVVLAGVDLRFIFRAAEVNVEIRFFGFGELKREIHRIIRLVELDDLRRTLFGDANTDHEEDQ